MKRIINGRRYDTEAPGSTLVAQACADGPTMTRTDFRFWEEELYRTSHGNWFLAGEGGPFSHWAKHTDGGTAWGDGIRPISKEQALEWLEHAGETEAIERYFTDSIEDA